MFHPAIIFTLCVALGTVAAPLLVQIDAGAFKPPVAKKDRKTFTTHGDTRVDDYFWLRDKNSPEVLAYLEAENAYTAAAMKPTEPLQKTLYNEMIVRLK